MSRERAREKGAAAAAALLLLADLERRDDAAVDGGVRDLVLAEGAVCEDGGDGVPFARDLLEIVLVDAMIHRKIGFQVRVARIEL